MIRRMVRASAAGILGLAAVAALGAQADAATFGELSSGQPNGQAQPYAPYTAGPYAVAPNGAGFGPPQMTGGAEGAPPQPMDVPGAATLPPQQPLQMPIGPTADLPHGTQQLWTFGQVNATTDPFNPWGLSTPNMFVPWSTPLSGWSNAENWNWWRKRSGAIPRNW